MPAGSAAPADLTATTGLTAYQSDGTTPSGATAWTTGQYAPLANSRHAWWNGSAWVDAIGGGAPLATSKTSK